MNSSNHSVPTLSHIDCYSYRGAGADLDTSSYVVLNPSQMPASMVIAGACAARESISSQVACRLSIEHFISGVLECFVGGEIAIPADGESAEDHSEENDEREKSLRVLEAAFRKANSSVYSFGHKLAAGGRMAASLIGVVVEDDTVAAGRVGEGSAYLYRGTELFPFFEAPAEVEEHKKEDDFVGAHSLVSVELASVQLEPNDLIYVFSSLLSSKEEQELSDLSKELDFESGSKGMNPCWEVSRFLFNDPNSLPFSIMAKVGPRALFLSKAA